ncbi:GAF domain-containing protein [Burkholderia sp. WP9]|jgi:GAF domain-containing protein|uniref:GAF domain-containing protein n=1 Tax=Burkholderia sp. WP9 TaxID=1500263 RepID=UPI0008947BAE|nr:GAF domain-containing protein [Burkholderia sp. WP9]SEE69687.1 GAF domain-containing protein [Burkholderia sp. WP9]
MTREQTLTHLSQAAHALGRAKDAATQWSGISHLARSVYGYGLLTGLVYLKEQRLMRRIFSTDDTISAPGGYKTTGKGPWSARVLDQGLPYIGSDEADIRCVFSEAELLIERGLHSVLNVPIWCAGNVIGSLNLLHHRHAYDHVDEQLIHLVSGICAPLFLLEKTREQDTAASVDPSGLESV